MLPLVSAIAILGIIPALSVLYGQFLDRDGTRQAAGLTVIISIGAMAAWLAASSLVPGVPQSPLWLPIASLAAVAAFVCSLPVRDVTSRTVTVLVYSLGWVVLVFVPLALAAFPPHFGIVAQVVPIDMGGALPVHIAAGASAMALLLVGRGFPMSGRSHPLPRTALLASSAVLLVGSWLAGMVGLELAIDGATPLIVADISLTPLAACAGWLVVERIHSKKITYSGAITGLLCGLVAATPGSGTLSPTWAIVTGATTGVVCAAFVFTRVRASGRRAWVLVGAHLLAAAIGLALVALFGEGFGFVFTGQMDIVATQLLATVVAAVWAAAVTLVLWPVARALPARHREPVAQ